MAGFFKGWLFNTGNLIVFSFFESFSSVYQDTNPIARFFLSGLLTIKTYEYNVKSSARMVGYTGNTWGKYEVFGSMIFGIVGIFDYNSNLRAKI